MKVLLVGGTSSLAGVVGPRLAEIADVTSAGRAGCDLLLDVGGPVESIRIPRGFDTVVHCAASFGGDTDAAVLEAEDVNALGTLKLCEAAFAAGVEHLVLVSSIFVCLPESSPFFNVYALSKRHSEEIAQYYCAKRALPLAVIRPSQIYGSSEQFRVHQPFLYTMADTAERGDDVTLYGTHDPRRNFIHVDDVAAAIVGVVEQRVTGTYSCVYPTDTTYTEIAEAAFAAFGAQSVVSFRDDKPDIPDNVFADDGELRRAIGWEPRVTIEDGMRKIAEHRRAAAGTAG